MKMQTRQRVIAPNDETLKEAEAVLNLEETTNEVLIEGETAEQITKKAVDALKDAGLDPNAD